MKDIIKAIVVLVAYFGVGPLLGMMIASSRPAQRAIFCLMVFMPSLHPGKLTLMVDSWEFYRGHTKGFEANWIEVLAISLILSSWLNRSRQQRWTLLAPGALLYLAWAAVSSISIFVAPDKGYALMAIFKFSKIVLLFIAGWHFLKDETDLIWVLRTMAAGQIFCALLCLKLRYVDGMFQIKGSFEHQNPMAMWVYMTAIPLLASMLCRKIPVRDFMLYCCGYGAAVVCIILTVSRAGLGALAAGSVVVLVLAWLRGPTLRLAAITGLGIFGAFIVAAFAMDSLNSRLDEVQQSSEKSEFDLRDVLNMQSAAMLLDSPIGVGWNNFGVLNSRPIGEKYSQILEEWDASRGFTIYEENYLANPLTESLYWLLLAENGYGGFLLFVCFALCTLWYALRVALHFRGSLWGAFATGQMVTLGICYLHGTVERILTQTKNLSFWLLMVGLIAAMEAHRRAASRVRGTERLTPVTSHPRRAAVGLSR